jgi:hypothetical protein
MLLYFFFGFHKMAITTDINPNSEIIGPIVIRRVEKISGLYASDVLGSPAIKKKPSTIKIKDITIRMKFTFERLYFIKLTIMFYK